MATTARARKTTAVKPTEAATEPAENETSAAPAPQDASPADGSPTAPDAAPLEPPVVHEPEEPPAETGYVTPTEVIPDEANLAEVILDDATKQPPTDVDAVFRPLTPYGSTLVCTMRLVERTFVGPHSNPIERLLQPKGATVSESVAARIRERLQKQAERVADTAGEK